MADLPGAIADRPPDRDPVPVTFAAVAAQRELLRRELPALLERYRGMWVVYLNGVQALCSTEDQALRLAYEHLGAQHPFVIAQVEPEQDLPPLLTAALAFGCGCGGGCGSSCGDSCRCGGGCGSSCGDSCRCGCSKGDSHR